MRFFLELLLIAALLAVIYAYGPVLWRRLTASGKEEGAPARSKLTARARHLAKEDERLREAVELRDKIADLTKRPKVGLGDDVVHEVDELIEAMVGIYDTRAALSQHLAGFTEERLARDQALLDAASLARQRRQLDQLRTRERGLEAELARATAGLRDTWLGLLDALAQSGGGAVTAERVRAQIESLRIRVQAEREARSELEVSIEG